ncbi:hypothetical protein CVT25_009524 [Psilocybe cyanescens]|uniref:Uncharacterized protein n=1 Tax=Psilocybe cyanescens TaxID=93625 RepID=A0A409WWS9_PSICY|nr:hypothetical protein CVT25_009524 [Psilocybe cyanescens]
MLFSFPGNLNIDSQKSLLEAIIKTAFEVHKKTCEVLLFDLMNYSKISRMYHLAEIIQDAEMITEYMHYRQSTFFKGDCIMHGYAHRTSRGNDCLHYKVIQDSIVHIFVCRESSSEEI